MQKEKIEEYASLRVKYHDNLQLVIPFAFIFAGVLIFIGSFINKKHDWFAYITGILGTYIFIHQLKERKKTKNRIKELKKELKL